MDHTPILDPRLVELTDRYARRTYPIEPEPQPEVTIVAETIHTHRSNFGDIEIRCWGYDMDALRPLLRDSLSKNVRLMIEDKNGTFAPESPRKIETYFEKSIGGQNVLIIKTVNQ